MITLYADDIRYVVTTVALSALTVVVFLCSISLVTFLLTTSFERLVELYMWRREVKAAKRELEEKERAAKRLRLKEAVDRGFSKWRHVVFELGQNDIEEVGALPITELDDRDTEPLDMCACGIRYTCEDHYYTAPRGRHSS